MLHFEEICIWKAPFFDLENKLNSFYKWLAVLWLVLALNNKSKFFHMYI